MTDGSYKYAGTSPTASYQRVCYVLYAASNPYIHSGVVYNMSGLIKSKWGAGPLVLHMPTYCPYSGTRKYYKR